MKEESFFPDGVERVSNDSSTEDLATEAADDKTVHVAEKVESRSV